MSEFSKQIKHHIMEGNYGAIKSMMISEGGGLMFYEDDLVSGVFLASRKGHANIIKLISEKIGLDLKKLLTKDGTSPLMYASEYGHLNVVNYLLGVWVDVNYVRPSDGMTALMLASLNGNIEVVKALLKKGAKIDLKRKNGKNSLNIAGNANHKNLAKFLVSQGVPMSNYFKGKYLQLLEEEAAPAAEPEPEPTPQPVAPPAVEEVGPESAGCFGAWCTPSRAKVAPSPSGGKTRRRKLRRKRTRRHM